MGEEEEISTQFSLPILRGPAASEFWSGAHIQFLGIGILSGCANRAER